MNELADISIFNHIQVGNVGANDSALFAAFNAAGDVHWKRHFAFGGDPSTINVVETESDGKAGYKVTYSNSVIAPVMVSLEDDKDEAIVKAKELFDTMKESAKAHRMEAKMSRFKNSAVFNSVADLQQLGNYVVGGYEQVNAGMLPPQLQEDLSLLTDSLVEGMEIAHERLSKGKDTPEKQAECELFMDMQRRYSDKIPAYASMASDLVLEDY